MNKNFFHSGNKLAWPTVQRLTEYLIILEQFHENGRKVVSSSELAETYSNTPSQVRQDIFRLPKTGRVGQGYNVRELADAIRKVLGLDRKTALVIVGCGRMGMALAQHVPFSEHGMCLAGLFDNNPSIVGREVKSAGLKIMGSATLGEFIKERNISIAALCVPTSVAQDVTDGLNATGIKGILNFTRKRLKVPPEVEILHAQFICSFIQLAYKCGTG